MARKQRARSRKGGRMETLALKLLVVGGLLAVVPFVMSSSLLGKGLAPLSGLGLLMLLGGALILWLQHISGGREAEPIERNRNTHTGARSSWRDASPVLLSDTAEAVAHAQSIQDHGFKALIERTRPRHWSAEVFSAIEWRRFEALVEALFAQRGYITKSQSHGADEGIDVRLYSPSQPDELMGLVQCKHWPAKRVGVDKVRELLGVMGKKNVKLGLLATSGSFTSDAQAFAENTSLELIDATELLKLIAALSPEQQYALLEIATQGEYWKPTCVNCGIKMTERMPHTGGAAFWGCVNFPRCKAILPMRHKDVC